MRSDIQEVERALNSYLAEYTRLSKMLEHILWLKSQPDLLDSLEETERWTRKNLDTIQKECHKRREEVVDAWKSCEHRWSPVGSSLFECLDCGHREIRGQYYRRS